MAQKAKAFRCFKDDEFEFMTELTLGAVYYQGAEVGECLATAARIKNGDAESWYQEWKATGDRVRGIAEGCEQRGHRVSARDAYLRAATYYNNAIYVIDGTPDPSRLVPTWTLHRDCWDKAAALFSPPVEPISIPYEGTTLPGYFFRVDGSGQRRPLLIMDNGSDGPVSAMWTQGGAAAIARGYNCLTFDGPGQGAALYRQRLYFRPDWEKVITPVVDYALGRAEVDPARIALIGVSQAGYWVPRAVAFEPRLAAAVADPGVWDVSTSWLGHLPKSMVRMLDKGEQKSFERWLRTAERFSGSMRAVLAFRLRPYGLKSEYDVFQAVRAYTLDGVADKIRCPLLITDPENEQFWPGQSQQLYDALPGPKELVRFTSEEGADSHCEPRAPGLRDQRVFDWLDETLGQGGRGVGSAGPGLGPSSSPT